MKTITYSDGAKKFIKNLDEPIKERFKNNINALAEGEVMSIFLKKPLANYQKLRIGRYRIVFQEKGENMIYIDNVEYRSKVYQK